MDKPLHRFRHLIKTTDWTGIGMLCILLFHLFLSNSYDNWSSFSQILLRGDAYASYCSPEEQKGPPLPGGRCSKQRLYVSKLLPIIRFSDFIFSSIAGLSYDRLGPVITSSMGIIFILLCWLFFGALINFDCCIVMGSLFLGMSVNSLNFPALEIKHRFPNTSNIVMSITGAASSVGAFLPMIINYVLERTKFSFRSVSLTYAFTIYPIDWMLIMFVFFKLKETTEVVKVDEKSENDENENAISLWECLKTVEFFCICVFFFVVNLTLTFHQYFITETYESDSYTVRILEFAFIASFIPCIILGAFVEKFGITLLLLFLNFFGLLVPIISLRPTEFAGILISLCIMIIYSMFLTSIWCYVQLRYPRHVFGAMSGIIFAIGGCAAMLCHPLFELCKTDVSRFNANIFMIIIRCISFIPLLYIHNVRHGKEISSNV